MNRMTKHFYQAGVVSPPLENGNPGFTIIISFKPWLMCQFQTFFVLCAGLTATKVSDHRFDPAAGLAVPNFGDPAVRDGSDSDSDSAATLVLGS